VRRKLGERHRDALFGEEEERGYTEEEGGRGREGKSRADERCGAVAIPP
jgi:hypothetical protein